MFVCNCKVKTDQILREEKGKGKNRKVTAVDSTTPQVENKGPVYHPVCCEVCSTEVGVFDEDEVYHFFNVIPSNSWTFWYCENCYRSAVFVDPELMWQLDKVKPAFLHGNYYSGILGNLDYQK